MQFLTTPSGAFPISLIYITVGVLMDVWTTVSLIYYPPESTWGKFLVVGFLITGAALLIIGLMLGQIGRAARHAELPPAEVTPAVAEAEKTAAAHPNPVISPVLSPEQSRKVSQPIVARGSAPAATDLSPSNVPTSSNVELLQR